MSSHAKTSGIKRGPYKKSYTEQDLLNAVKMYVCAERSSKKVFSHVATYHDVPENTLRDYHKRYMQAIASFPRHPNPTVVLKESVRSARSSGRELLLSEHLEHQLFTWINAVGAITDAPSVTLIRLKAQRLLFAEQKVSITDENRDKIIGRKWWRGFQQRHPTLSTRNTIPLSIAKARATQPEIINHFFDLLKHNMDTYAFTAQDIWAIDETGVSGKQKSSKAVGEKGTNKHNTTTRTCHACPCMFVVSCVMFVSMS
jgi:hypothetical protein